MVAREQTTTYQILLWECEWVCAKIYHAASLKMYEDFNTPNKSREIWHAKQEAWRAAIVVAIKKYCIMEEFEIVGVGVVRKYEHSDTVAFHRCALFVFVFVYVWGRVFVHRPHRQNK